MDPSLWQTLVELVTLLGQLAVQLFALGMHWILLIMWIAWWLLGVSWRKAWPALGNGGWAPLVLLVLVVSLVWSRLQPGSCDCIGVVVPNFWWQLGYVAMLVAVALFCGWLQGVLHWQPAEINLDPPVHAHGDGHGHAAHH
jgi:hypothetical protein